MGVDLCIQIIPDDELRAALADPSLHWDWSKPDSFEQRYPDDFDSHRGWDKLHWLLSQYAETRECADSLLRYGGSMIIDPEIGEDEWEWAKVIESTRVSELWSQAGAKILELRQTTFPLEAMRDVDLYRKKSLDTKTEIKRERRFLWQLLADLEETFCQAIERRHGFLIYFG